MQNARLDEAQDVIKISGRNINNLRYADDTTLMAESDKELTTSWWWWKRRVKKLDNIQKMKIMASGLITEWQIDGEKMKTLTDYFLGLQNHFRWWLQPWN